VSLSSMATRKTPIMPLRYSHDESPWKMGTTGRKISLQGKRVRRRSEPFLFSSAGKLRASSIGAPARQFQALSHKRRISTANPILPNANKIRLQELANTELLVSLNEPFGKSELEQDVSGYEGDEIDFKVSEQESEQQKLTELKRVKVIEEIFETERKYIACLDTLDRVFRLPMLDGGIAQDKDVNALFPSCLSTIRECHAWFMEQLENRMKSEDWSGSIGDILGKMAGPLQDNLLNIYTDYVNSFPKSISTFSKCSRGSQKFRKFIEECYCKSDNLDLPSYLITPVQRLPRYVLLLRQLSKYTQEDHPDNESIQRALQQMEELISSLNSSIHNSMQAYSARESEARKTIRRQLSRRRKKPRPTSLNMREVKAAEEKSKKVPSPDENDNRLCRNDVIDSRRSTLNENTPSDERDATRDDGTQRGKLTTPNDLSTQPVVFRKNKPESRKSFRRSLGAALSSLWSPREDKDSRNANNHYEPVRPDGKLQDHHSTKDSLPLRRKVGVSYPLPSQMLDSGSIDLAVTPNSESEAVKKRRYSGSFRERTRNFRIQLRRRSGTWFTATGDKDSDFDLISHSNAAEKAPSMSIGSDSSCDDSSMSTLSRNSKTRSSFISIFSKRKSKNYSDENPEPVTRRRSECNQSKVEPDDLPHRGLSTSVSAPIITYPAKESKESTVPEMISEEPVDNETELNGLDSKYVNSDNPKSPCEENVTTNGASSPLSDGNSTVANDKKRKKGKIMKTLRSLIGKGKN